MKRDEADYCKKIEVWRLNEWEYLSDSRSGSIEWVNEWGGNRSTVGLQSLWLTSEKAIQFNYSLTNKNGEVKSFNYKITLTTTPCYFGGVRYWFICPWYKNEKYCGRRVGVLYLNGNYFACRHCYELSYKSRNKNRNGRFYHLFYMLDIADKVEKIQLVTKREYYAGKPTRNARRIEKMYKKTDRYAKFLE